jgi:hypothetical protein
MQRSARHFPSRVKGGTAERTLRKSLGRPVSAAAWIDSLLVALRLLAISFIVPVVLSASSASNRWRWSISEAPSFRAISAALAIEWSVSSEPTETPCPRSFSACAKITLRSHLSTLPAVPRPAASKQLLANPLRIASSAASLWNVRNGTSLSLQNVRRSSRRSRNSSSSGSLPSSPFITQPAQT